MVWRSIDAIAFGAWACIAVHKFCSVSSSVTKLNIKDTTIYRQHADGFLPLHAQLASSDPAVCFKKIVLEF